MSYKHTGVQNVLTSLDLLKAISSSACHDGQLIAVKNVVWSESSVNRKFTTVYMWDSQATARSVLADLNDDDSSVDFPAIAKAWYWNRDYSSSTVFDEGSHMGDYGHMIIIPDDVGPVTETGRDYSQPGRWVATDYATFLLHAGFTQWDARSDGSLIPKSNAAFDLGDADNKVRHLFLSDNSIWVGDQNRISINTSTGQIRFQRRKNGKIPEGLAQKINESIALKSITDLGHSTSKHGDLTQGYELSLTEWKQVADDTGVSYSSPVDLFEDDDFIDVSTMGDMNDYTKTADLPGALSNHFGPKAEVDVLNGYFNGGVLSPSFAHNDLKNSNLLDGAGLLKDSITPGGLKNSALLDGAGFLKDSVTPGTLKNDQVDFSDYTKTINLGAVTGVDLTPYARIDQVFDGGGKIQPGLYDNTDTIPTWDTLGGKPDLADYAKNSELWAGGTPGSQLKSDIYDDTVPTWSTLSGAPNMNEYTKTSGLPSAITKTVDSHAAVVAATVVGGYFKNGKLKVDNAHDDLKNDQVDFSDYTKTSGLGAVISGNADVLAGKGAAADVTTLNNQQGTIDDALHALYRKAVTSKDALEYTGRDGSRGANITDPIGGGNADIVAAVDARADVRMTHRGLSSTGLSGIIQGQMNNRGLTADGLDSLISDNSDVKNAKDNAATAYGYFSGGKLKTDHINANLKTAVTDLADHAVTKQTVSYNNKNSLSMGGVGLTAYVSAMSDVQAGVTAKGYFNSSGTLSSSSRVPSLTTSKISGLQTTLNQKASTTSVSNVSSALIDKNWMTKAELGLPSNFTSSVIAINSLTTYSSTNTAWMAAALVAANSDQDLKNIIRMIPAAEITTDYHLIGLNVYEYEWLPIANELFGKSGTVAQGFIAEQLELLFPAPDPNNPPTSINDGHIWWHYYTTAEEKAANPEAHEYYTQYNPMMLQAEIDAAKAKL